MYRLDHLFATEALGQLVGDLLVPALLDQSRGRLDVLDPDHQLAADLKSVDDHLSVTGAGCGERVSVGVAGSVFCGHGGT